MSDIEAQGAEGEILADAVEKTAKAYQENPSVSNLREWNAAKAAMEKFRRDQESGGAPRLKNLAEVSRWLIREGYKVQERTVRNHYKQHLFPAQPGGEFLLRDIEAYAQRHLDRPGHESQGIEPTSKDRLTAAMAQERELRVKKLEGALLDAAEEEARDARLWRAVRYEVEQQAPSVINELMEQVLSLPEISEELRQRMVSLIPGLRVTYEENIADIFNRFAVDGGVWVEE